MKTLNLFFFYTIPSVAWKILFHIGWISAVISISIIFDYTVFTDRVLRYTSAVGLSSLMVCMFIKAYLKQLSVFEGSPSKLEIYTEKEGIGPFIVTIIIFAMSLFACASMAYVFIGSAIFATIIVFAGGSLGNFLVEKIGKRINKVYFDPGFGPQ